MLNDKIEKKNQLKKEQKKTCINSGWPAKPGTYVMRLE